MTVDLRELQRALAKLRYTTPLGEGDPGYVSRPDDLGQKVLGRVMAPGTHRLLLGGPAGCGKSTEILRINRLAQADYTVVICPCDRDLDLYKLELVTLVRYLTWRILFVATTVVSQKLTLTPEIMREALACIGAPTLLLPSPRMFFAGAGGKASDVDPARLFDTFSRLLSEIERGFKPVLLLVDGLEKVPPSLREETLGNFVRSPLLDGCQTVIVVPLWTLYGKDSMEFYPDVEVLRIGLEDQASSAFVHEIVEKRAGPVFVGAALNLLAAFSGGLPRDGLQLAWRACREAMDERTSDKVESRHVIQALDVIQQGFEAMLSDDPRRARDFLLSVRQTCRLPGDPAFRDLVLGHGIVLPAADGTFRVHPAMNDFLDRRVVPVGPAPAA
jgi:AAA ATPase domain